MKIVDLTDAINEALTRLGYHSHRGESYAQIYNIARTQSGLSMVGIRGNAPCAALQTNYRLARRRYILNGYLSATEFYQIANLTMSIFANQPSVGEKIIKSNGQRFAVACHDGDLRAHLSFYPNRLVRNSDYRVNFNCGFEYRSPYVRFPRDTIGRFYFDDSDVVFEKQYDAVKYSLSN